MNIPFTPGLSVKLSATPASSRVALPNPSVASRTVMVSEELGLESAFIAFGDVTVDAVVPVGATPVNGYMVLPGSKEPLTVPGTATHVAAITASGTADLYFTSGDGI